MKMPCVASPCSPRLSPWSAVTSTSVSSISRVVRRAPRSSRAELAIDECDLAVVRCRAEALGEIGAAAHMAHAGRSSAPRETRALRLSVVDGWSAEPPERGVRRRIRGPLHVRGAAQVVPAGQVVVVGVEARDRTRSGDRAGTRRRTPPCGSPPAGTPRRPCLPPARARSRCCSGTRGRAACGRSGSTRATAQ